MVKHQRKHSAADRPGPSPSQRYAAFQKRQAHNASVAARFAATLPFDLDDFQQDAIDALERGENVLVAAPTGAGKTVVADFAMYLAARAQCQGVLYHADQGVEQPEVP